MNTDSRPDYNMAQPTFEEVVAYATQNGLYGKLNLSKFYDYYAKQGFCYNGYLMDWKKKMADWAARQTGPVMETGRERDAKPKEPINTRQLETIQNILRGMVTA